MISAYIPFRGFLSEHLFPCAWHSYKTVPRTGVTGWKLRPFGLALLTCQPRQIPVDGVFHLLPEKLHTRVVFSGLPPVAVRRCTCRESAAQHRARQTFIDLSEQPGGYCETVRGGGVVITGAFEERAHIL